MPWPRSIDPRAMCTWMPTVRRRRRWRRTPSRRRPYHVVVVGGGGAAGQGELGKGDGGGGVDVLGRQASPDRIQLGQPSEQIIADGAAAGHPLVEVVVGVDQAGGDDVAVDPDDLVPARRPPTPRRRSARPRRPRPPASGPPAGQVGSCHWLVDGPSTMSSRRRRRSWRSRPAAAACSAAGESPAAGRCRGEDHPGVLAHRDDQLNFSPVGVIEGVEGGVFIAVEPVQAGDGLVDHRLRAAGPRGWPPRPVRVPADQLQLALRRGVGTARRERPAQVVDILEGPGVVGLLGEPGRPLEQRPEGGHELGAVHLVGLVDAENLVAPGTGSTRVTSCPCPPRR